MDSKVIQQILDKYWEGETSLQEEAQLREFFSRDDVPESLRAIQPMFQFYKQEQEAFLNGDFDERLSSKLKAADNQVPRRATIVRMISRAAAIAAIFIGVFWVYKINSVETLNKPEKLEAQMAYQEAKAALMLISRKLKKGTGKAEEGINRTRKATKVIR